MTIKHLNLQLFAEGGGTAGGASAGGDSGNAGNAQNGGSGATAGEDLSQVTYGVSNTSVAGSNGETSTSPEDKAKAFENMIKKGGDYAEEFNKKTQAIIDKRFKQAKETESKLQSHQPIMDLLSTKYGVDANDVEGLLAAIDEDDSWLEEKAFEEGLTTKQLKQKMALERENAQLKAAEEEARRKANGEQIYSQWVAESEDMVRKYGIQNFDLQAEVANPDFTALLASGVGFESAYKAIHFDDMLGGAMAQTAKNVEQGIANRIASRQNRPSEGAVSSQNANTFKSDVNSLTNADIDEVLRRVRRGERITFG